MDCSPPGSFVHGIFQARILEWIAVPSCKGSSQPRNQTHVSCTGRQILYHWATRESQNTGYPAEFEFEIKNKGFSWYKYIQWNIWMSCIYLAPLNKDSAHSWWKRDVSIVLKLHVSLWKVCHIRPVGNSTSAHRSRYMHHRGTVWVECVYYCPSLHWRDDLLQLGDSIYIWEVAKHPGTQPLRQE